MPYMQFSTVSSPDASSCPPSRATGWFSDMVRLSSLNYAVQYGMLRYLCTQMFAYVQNLMSLSGSNLLAASARPSIPF